jgi:hypothetical protein
MMPMPLWHVAPCQRETRALQDKFEGIAARAWLFPKRKIPQGGWMEYTLEELQKKWNVKKY